MTVIPDEEAFHRYTREGFACDEAVQMAQRYTPFNVEALAEIAAKAVGSVSFLSMEKNTDGLYNKAFLLTMDDGAQVVAKIPNPNAGRSHLTIASEVATMDYVRNELQTPASKVYAWCSHADQTPVEAEYIIMEKVQGVPLENIIPKMVIQQRYTLARAVARYQIQWAAAQFENYGSLYYKSSLGGTLASKGVTAGSSSSQKGYYAVGRTNERIYNGAGRSALQIDIGPYTDILKPCLFHPNLHSKNIFVDPEDPTEITVFIDWQTAGNAPLFVETKRPAFFDHEGPQANGLEEPQLPEDFEDLPESEQKQAEELWYQQILVALYDTTVSEESPEVWKSMQFRETEEFTLLLLARVLLTDGDAVYLAAVLDYLDSHPELTDGGHADGPSPRDRLYALLKERTAIEKNAKAASLAMEYMQEIRRVMGDLVADQGLIADENYDKAQERLQRIKEKAIERLARNDQERLAWENSWPFDD